MSVRASKTQSAEDSTLSCEGSASPASDNPQSESDKPTPAFPIVGLGASAGGLQALSAFFDATPADSRLGFVVIQHLDPDHKSLMPDLLGKHTSMPVALAADGVAVAPNHVYVIPPGQDLGIEAGVLHLSEARTARGVRLPINYFLESLARDRCEAAIAIILSGAGADGAAGIAEIKDCGGIVIVQDPTEAMHDSMPRSAIATNAVDYVLPVVEMPKLLVAYRQHPYVTRPDTTSPAAVRNTQESLPSIIEVLKAQSPVDFTHYKLGTLVRRTECRMALHHLQNAADYLTLLKDSADEALALCLDLLISVTAFFRDACTFRYLAEDVLPALLADHDLSRPVRVWIPGCATGEEAYSLAMLRLDGVSAQRKDVKLQLFASDVDERALSIAREGVYPDSIEQSVSTTRLERFFSKEDHSYRVSFELRESVVFADQNVLADAPFSKLDLISCRNLLIYLNTEAQERILHLFRFALNDGGLLLLGSSETPGSEAGRFKPRSREHHIFQRVGTIRTDPNTFQFPLLGPPYPARRPSKSRDWRCSANDYCSSTMPLPPP